MDVMEAIKGRRSIRNYRERDVEEEKVKKILEAARWAPSGNNRQPWQFIVITERKTREKLMEAAHSQTFVKQAPVVIVVCNKRDSNLINIGLTMQNICLEAYALGLGTCIVGWFRKNIVRRILGIPNTNEPAYLITVGYPAEQPKKGRKSLDELVHYEEW